MSLFNQILGAIDNPRKQASPSQLGGIMNTINTLSQSYNANPSAIQSAMTIVGKYAKSALKEKRQQQGEAGVQQLVGQYGGTNASNQAVQSLFSTPQLQSLTNELERKTGINGGTVQLILPVLVPLVLNFLKTGNNSGASLGRNPILSNFLDADGDGDVDIADALKLAGKYV